MTLAKGYGIMNITKLPTSRNVLPTFQTFCPVGIQVAQTVFHFAHFQVQSEKRDVLGGFGGVLCTYISQKGVRDG